MAGTTGLEPATSCVTGMRSNQLSYAPIKGRRLLYEPEDINASPKMGLLGLLYHKGGGPTSTTIVAATLS